MKIRRFVSFIQTNLKRYFSKYKKQIDMTKVVQVIRYSKFCCFTFKFTQLSSNTKLIVQMTSFSFYSKIHYNFIGETHGNCVKLLLKQITCYNWTGSICLTQAVICCTCCKSGLWKLDLWCSQCLSYVTLQMLATGCL